MPALSAGLARILIIIIIIIIIIIVARPNWALANVQAIQGEGLKTMSNT